MTSTIYCLNTISIKVQTLAEWGNFCQEASKSIMTQKWIAQKTKTTVENHNSKGSKRNCCFLLLSEVTWGECQTLRWCSSLMNFIHITNLNLLPKSRVAETTRQLTWCLTWSFEALYIGIVNVILTGPHSLVIFPVSNKKNKEKKSKSSRVNWITPKTC